MYLMNNVQIQLSYEIHLTDPLIAKHLVICADIWLEVLVLQDFIIN